MFIVFDERACSVSLNFECLIPLSDSMVDGCMHSFNPFLFSFFSKLTNNTTFTNLAEQISRIEPPYPHDWLPYTSSDELLGSSAPDGRHRYSASEEDDEDEEDVSLVRVRPRTGSLSEHEDLLALKAQAQAVIRREEAGYDVSFLVVPKPSVTNFDGAVDPFYKWLQI